MWRPANWAIAETTRTIPKIKATIHYIREIADAERKKLPTIKYTAWTQSMRRAPGDPYARGPPGDDVLMNDIPRLADRFTALAERFRELEEKPYRRGDVCLTDLGQSLRRGSVLILPIGCHGGL